MATEGSRMKPKKIVNKSDKDSKLDLLKHLHLVIRDELSDLRNRQIRIFTWSSYILLLVLGGLLIIDPSKLPVWENQGTLGKSVASATLLVVIVFSIIWQQRTRKFQEEVFQTHSRIEHLLHCFEKGYYESLSGSLYPERWGEPKDFRKRVSFWRRIFGVNYVSATALLGILAIAMVWLS
jgi:hypothetical protein